MSTQLHDALHELAREHDAATERDPKPDIEFRDSMWVEVPKREAPARPAPEPPTPPTLWADPNDGTWGDTDRLWGEP
jgi:hypothetical protein